jgi:hypothetical protein
MIFELEPGQIVIADYEQEFPGPRLIVRLGEFRVCEFIGP